MGSISEGSTIKQVIIENAQLKDLGEIVEIYNWAIENTTATFDTQPKTIESQEIWYEAHSDEFPIIVAKLENIVVGWGAISQWSDRCAYSGTGEISFYVHRDYHGRGIGSKILQELVKIGRSKGFRTLVSRIAGESAGSIHLHKKLGFSNIGTMKSVGKKFDKILDVHLMQILY